MHPHIPERPARAALLGLALFALPASGGSIALRWDPVSQASGYRLYYGTRSGQYDQSVDVGNVTETTLQDLQDCRDYYVAAKAYGASGESASYSNEVSGWPRPRINALDPVSVRQGAQFTLNITGANFEPGASLVVADGALPRDAAGNPLIHFGTAQVVSCTRIQVFVTVEATARGFRAMEVGPLTLPFEVRNPDSVFGTAQGTLEIRFAVHRADINRSDASTRDRVDGKDLSWLAYSHGSADGSPYYNPDADLDGDGLVDGEDLALLAPHFGACWAGSTWRADVCP